MYGLWEDRGVLQTEAARVGEMTIWDVRVDQKSYTAEVNENRYVLRGVIAELHIEHYVTGTALRGEYHL